MYCSRCGNQFDLGARYCPTCGAPTLHPGTPPAPRSSTTWWKVAAVSSAVVVAVLAASALLLVGYETVDPSGGGVEVTPDPSVAAIEPSTSPFPSPSPSDESAASAPAVTSPAEPSPPADFASLFANVRSGVVKIQASTCDGTGVGSGFLVGPHRVVTAAHVVEGAASVVVSNAGDAIPATVIGVDAEYDLAVLEVSSAMTGHVFDLETSITSPGSAVAVIGHPLGDPLTITQGVVSRVGPQLWPHVQVDASINPGNSGGPVVDHDGDVIGIVVAKRVDADGVGWALRSDVARTYVQQPSTLAPAAPADCDRPLGPDTGDLPALEATDELHVAIATTLASYFGGINSGDYALAYDQMSPRLRSSSTYDGFADGVSTSYDFGFEFQAVRPSSEGAVVWLEFVSLQDPALGPEGEGCTEWSLDYQLIWSGDGRLLIDRVRGHGGFEGHVPCG